MRIRGGAAVLAALGVLSCGTALADVPAPQSGGPCPTEIDGAMTLLGDGQTYAVCRENTWVGVQTPFEPDDRWLSYGPAITLHGQGMRNPNLLSGNWTAAALDAETACRAEEQTVVEAGVLSDPQIFEGPRGGSLALPMLPGLFYVKLSGYCLWTRN